MKKILLITIGLSVCVFADFSRSGDIVTDNVTNLQWQDDIQIKTTVESWQKAIDHCEALTLGGFSDWRLPNVNELASIVDDTKYKPSIDTAFYNVTTSHFNYYWSSTTHAYYSYNAWMVSFNDGNQLNGGKPKPRFVRCVRAG